MSWLPYAIFGFLVVVLCTLLVGVSLFGFDAAMLVGLIAGGLIGLGLMAFSAISLKKALARTDRKLALGHSLGGFGLRMVILVSGVSLLALTGWGDPVGFVLAFMVTVVLWLGVQTHWITRQLERARLERQRDNTPVAALEA